MPRLIRLAEDDQFLLVYRESDRGHADVTGRLVSRRSMDGGYRWSTPRTIHDDPERNVGAPSVIKCEPSGRLAMFFRVMDPRHQHEVSRDRDFETLYSVSDDGGRTWSAPSTCTDALRTDQPHPFGGGIRTDRGIMTCFYESTGGVIEALFGQRNEFNWSDSVIVGDSRDNPSRSLTEPVPCAVSERKLIVFGRDNQSGDFFAIRSEDVGESWQEPVYFHPTGSSVPTPLWVQRSGSGRLIVAWGDREDGMLYLLRSDLHRVWKDPTCLEECPVVPLTRSECGRSSLSYWKGDAGDFGYPSLEWGSPAEDRIYAAFYDGPRRPNIWISSFSWEQDAEVSPAG